MHDELVRTLAAVPDGSFNFVTCAGLWGTYDDGLAWLKQPENAEKPKAILSMGSSIGNFTPAEAVDFIAQFASELGPEDLMLIALDGCQDADKVYNAYNDKNDVTHKFTANGLKHANRLLGYEAFKPGLWDAIGQYDPEGSRHQAFVVPNTDVTVEGADIKKGEKIRIEESYKWPFQKAEKLWKEAGVLHSVILGASFPNMDGSYCKCFVAYSLLGITCLLPTTSYHTISLSSIQLLTFTYSPTLAQSIKNDCFIEARAICGSSCAKPGRVQRTMELLVSIPYVEPKQRLGNKGRVQNYMALSKTTEKLPFSLGRCLTRATSLPFPYCRHLSKC